MGNTRTKQEIRSVYCITVFHMKKAYGGSNVRIDQYAELVGVEDNIATIVSRKYGISADSIDFVSISFATNSNAHLGFCGQVTEVILDHGAAIYTIEIPKTKRLDLKNGTIIEVPNESLVKYKNIHKAKHVGSKKKNATETAEANNTEEGNENYDECNRIDKGTC